MKIKDLEIGYLFDFYGELLSERQREIFSLYYDEDLSLSEVAEQVGITRQGVRDTVKKSEEQLISLEAKLGLAARFKEISKKSDGIIEKLEKLKAPLAESAELDKIIAEVRSLAEL